MGNNQGKRPAASNEAQTPASQPPQPQPQEQKQQQKASPPPAAEPKKLDPCDVVISATPGDATLVSLLKSKIQSAGYTVFSNTSKKDEDTRTLGRMLVDAKLLVFVMSEDSVSDNKCSDQVSLAYISNKPILLAARKAKEQLMPTISFGLKLTLQNLAWTVFDSDTPDDGIINQFLHSVKAYQAPVNETVEVEVEQPLGLEGPPQKSQRMRLNTKLRSATAAEDAGETVVDTFWERNFGDDTSVPWYKFQQSFLTDYDEELKGLFPENQVPWLLDMLQNDIFGGAKEITRDHFYNVRGESKEKNTFWRVISQIAVERFNMQEVFNMQSTVRLTAVESLGKFHNPAVVEALLRLLDDEDANIRAVAAISIGRTGVQDEAIFDKLIEKLKDGDRIVRQSVCLSLGALKAKKAIPHISNLWRNDFISVVRDAARTALQKMGVPEAEEVLKVTRILEEEIKHLEGNISSV